MKNFMCQFESVPMECIVSLKMLESKYVQSLGEGPLKCSVLRIKREI